MSAASTETDDLIRRLDSALSFGTTGRDALPTLLQDCRAALSRQPVYGECEECGQTVLTPLKRFDATGSGS